jgi:hypothetical protein
MFYRLSAREKLIFSDPPDFQQPLFRIEWQPISISAGRECGRFQNPFTFRLEAANPQSRTAFPEDLTTSDCKSHGINTCGIKEFKPIEMNTCRKNGRGYPVSGFSALNGLWRNSLAMRTCETLAGSHVE